jgi:hypothetical protein
MAVCFRISKLAKAMHFLNDVELEFLICLSVIRKSRKSFLNLS